MSFPAERRQKSGNDSGSGADAVETGKRMKPHGILKEPPARASGPAALPKEEGKISHLFLTKNGFQGLTEREEGVILRSEIGSETGLSSAERLFEV